MILPTGDSTLFFSINNNLDSLNFESVWFEKPIQLDTEGNHEVILKHVKDYKNKHIKTIFIINTDKKKVMFSGDYIYSNRVETCSFTTTFNDNNELIIDYGMYQTSSPYSNSDEGIYALHKGEYKWQRPLIIFEKKILFVNDSLGIEVIRKSNNEKNLSQYFVFYNNKKDSILFRSDHFCCPSSTHEIRNNESVKLDFHQLDGTGNPELLLEYKYSSESRYGEDLAIINLDSGVVMFTVVLEKHIPGGSEPPSEPFFIINEITYTEQGNLIVQNNLKPSIYLEYRLVNGKYILIYE